MNNIVVNTIATLLLLSLFITVNAATIIVDRSDGIIADDGGCSISEAILAANTDMMQFPTPGECAAGSGADTIELTTNITLTQAYQNDVNIGSTGTPAMSTALVLDGMGFTVQRDNTLTCNSSGLNDMGEFRILRTTTSANLTLQNITIAHGCVDGSGGDVNRGAGLHNLGALTITTSTFNQNQAGNAGGALYHGDGILSEISNSTFSGNSAGAGGAIRNGNTATITIIQNSTFLGNSVSVFGGAISNSGPLTTIQNSTFSANLADVFGGAIYNDFATIDTIQNSTFSGNLASNGGAILNHNSGTINTLQNSIFHNNGSEDCINNGPAFNGNNNLSNNLSGGCPGLLATALTASTIGALADNGGATLTHGLLANSEALDAAVAGTNNGQRGFGLNGERDIGAYEAQSLEFCPSVLQIDGFTITVYYETELIQAIECANFNGNTVVDTINLGADIILTQEYENDITYGRTGTPAINTALTLDGKGFNLQRDDNLTCGLNNDNDPNEFRILRTTTSADLTLQNITIAYGCVDGNGGFGDTGGGLYNLGVLTIVNTTFNQNQALSDGGAIYHKEGLISEISRSTFSGNIAIGREGGAIFNSAFISIIQNTTFSDNQGVRGGAIFNEGGLTIQNSTFSQNYGDHFGGAIFNVNTINSIQNSTFYRNRASFDGEAIYNQIGSLIVFQNSLFNSEGIVKECENNFGTFGGSNNLSTNLSGGCPGLLATPLTASTIDALSDNGGATLTHALFTGSEAIDMAIGGTNNDQRGLTANGTRDIGAFEYYSQYNLAIQVSGLSASNSISFGNSGNGSLVFTTNETKIIDILDIGEAFNVSISSAQLDTPGQFCFFTQANSGNLGNGHLTITVECIDTFIFTDGFE